MQMMDYQDCLDYVVEHDLQIIHNASGGEGSWVISNGNHPDFKSALAPTYVGAVNTYKAKHGEPCDPTAPK
jgi:hypothetical protein